MIQNKDRENLFLEESEEIKELEKLIEKLYRQNNKQSFLLRTYEEENEDLRRRFSETNLAYHIILNSASWKVTAPVRGFLDRLKKRPTFVKFVGWLSKFKNHLSSFIHRILKWLKGRFYKWGKYRVLDALLLYTPIELEKQRKIQGDFEKNIKFSIVVALYNTPTGYLHDMIQSVQDQTYENWELCIADGSDGDHAEVGRICKKYARREKRIKYRKLETNFGISGNLNAGLEMAVGDYVGFLDHDDILHPAALYEMMTEICKKDVDVLYTDEAIFDGLDEGNITIRHYKSDFAPDSLRTNNYICHFLVVSKTLLAKAGGRFCSEYDGAQDYDLTLRLMENTSKIRHIPKILYFWRSHEGSTAAGADAKIYANEAGRKAVSAHLERIGLSGNVSLSQAFCIYRIKYELNGYPKVSILIPNYEHKWDLKICLDSIYEKTTYPNYEVIVIENNSNSMEIRRYYETIQKKWDNLKVVVYEGEFNYSVINNFGAGFATGEYLLLLNNDIEVITPDWIQEMLMYAQRPDVGAVGAKLYYPNGQIQHGGVILGIEPVAGHSHKCYHHDSPGYMGRLVAVQNYTAVTAACMMVRRSLWEELEGLREEFAVTYNDVDFCMRIRKAGYLVVWTPYAELYHYESKSRGNDDTTEKKQREREEIECFYRYWSKELVAGDPYYNPNLTSKREDFTYKGSGEKSSH